MLRHKTIVSCFKVLLIQMFKGALKILLVRAGMVRVCLLGSAYQTYNSCFISFDLANYITGGELFPNFQCPRLNSSFLHCWGQSRQAYYCVWWIIRMWRQRRGENSSALTNIIDNTRCRFPGRVSNHKHVNGMFAIATISMLLRRRYLWVALKKGSRC